MGFDGSSGGGGKGMRFGIISDLDHDSGSSSGIGSGHNGGSKGLGIGVSGCLSFGMVFNGRRWCTRGEPREESSDFRGLRGDKAKSVNSRMRSLGPRILLDDLTAGPGYG